MFSEKRDAVLLIFRADVPVWVLPGGGVEPKEAPEAAVHREILEETGLVTEKARLVGTYHPINRLAKRTQVYECQVKGGSLKTSEESLSVQFFPLAALPKNIPPPYRNWIEEGLAVAPPIERPLYELTYRMLFFSLLSHPLLVFRFLLSRMGLPMNSRRSSNPVKKVVKDGERHLDDD